MTAALGGDSSECGGAPAGAGGDCCCSTASTALKQQQQQPASWGELCQSYRDGWGARSYSTISDPRAVVQQRFARSVPTMCPLAEIRHPLFATGEPLHQPNEEDGSLYRSQRHGWGNPTLLRHDAPSAAADAAATAAAAAARRAARADRPPAAKDGRRSLFGTLAGTEAGGTDSWIGNPLIDPTRGRRSVRPPPDPKGRKGLGEVLSLASPGKPEDDAWLGCIGIDPARGRGHAASGGALGSRGARRGLFRVLQPDRPPAAWEIVEAAEARDDAGGASASSTVRKEAARGEMDAWIGNRGIPSWGGKRSASAGAGGGLPAAAEEHLWGGTFRQGVLQPCNYGEAASDGEKPRPWSDLPRIGRRPLPAPPSLRGAVTAAHTLRQSEALPPGTKPPQLKPPGKKILPEPRRAAAVDVYSLLKFKDISAGGGEGSGGLECGERQQQQQEQQRQRLAWNDADQQPRRRPPPAAAQHGGGGHGAAAAAAAPPGLLDWAPNRAARFVPFGGIAQEKGMSLDAVAAIAAIARKGGGTMARSAVAAGTGVGVGAGGVGGQQQRQSSGGGGK